MQLLKSIPYQSLPFHNQLVKDYLSGASQLRSFYSQDPSLEGLLDAADKRELSMDTRTILSNSLLRQYGQLLSEGVVKENIQKLRDQNSYTITTGHQLCAYTGPAYFIYKIASVINLSQQLNALDKSKSFIPVFWMASEDHDFDEIAEVHFNGKGWKWEKTDDSYGKVPVGILDPAAIASWAEEMKKYFRDEPEFVEVLDIFEQAYEGSESLSDATRKILHELFQNFGLVVIDGNDKELKNLFKPILNKEIKDKTSFKALINSTEELKQLSYEAQISAREINLFYLGTNNLRERIDRHETGFKLLNSQSILSESELLHELDTSPEKFSPNVVMRPVYQETILPNIAYIGGPGEIAYWLQLKGVFESYNIMFPVLLARSSFLVLTDTIVEKAAKYKFEWSDYLIRDADELIGSYIKEGNSTELNFENERKYIDEIFASINMRAKEIDPQLFPQLAVEQKNMIESLTKIQTKFTKSLKQKAELDIKNIQRIKSNLFPQNVLQERIMSGIDIYGLGQNKLGSLIKMANPLENELKLLKN